MILVSWITSLNKLLTAEQVTFTWLKLTSTLSFITLEVLQPPSLTATSSWLPWRSMPSTVHFITDGGFDSSLEH